MDGAFIITAEDSAAFARLSGDFNPMHLDPVAARRTPYGGTVVHGVHLALKAVDELAAHGALAALEPAALTVKFRNPVPTGAVVRLRFTPDADGRRIRVTGECDERTAFSAILELRERTLQATEPEDLEFGPEPPQAMVFPPAAAAASVPLRLSHRLCAALLPALARAAAAAWIADVAATTRIVGMRCPGADSIFSALQLKRVDSPAEGPATMRYHVDRNDARFRTIRMQVRGAMLAGNIEALFRPRPVEQMALRDVLATALRGISAGHRVLVIGGCRGLGELTAKIVMAGGAEHTTITYARGRDDGERVAAEARAAGFDCAARRLDVAVPAIDQLPEWLDSMPFTHVYYFASPTIARNTGSWSETLFEQFAHVYVRGFALLAARLVTAAAARGAPRFLYPSSVFLDRYENGFAEYCAAKGAGEALCEQLQHRYGTPFAKPRLPRMKTDQTSGVPEGAAEDPFPVMQRVVRDFHS